MQKNLLKVLPISIVVIVATIVCSSNVWARHNIDTQARQSHARSLINYSASVDASSKLTSYIASQRAHAIDPADTSIMLWSNMQRLFAMTNAKDCYTQQLNLVLSNPATPIDYYPSLIVLAHIYEPEDTLLAYRLAHLAQKRHPQNRYIGQHALNLGKDILEHSRYTSEGDTLPMTAAHRAFAHELTQYADSLIGQYGRNPGIDMAKARIYYILGDTTSLRNLADKMYLQEAEDPEILNNLTIIFSAINDTARVFECGLKSIELQPDFKPVQNMFAMANNPDDLVRLQSKVMGIAQNIMYEPELRAEVLNGVVMGTFRRNYNLIIEMHTDIEVPDSSLTYQLDKRFFNRVDSMAREIIAEEPDNYQITEYVADMGNGTSWMTKYGYKYLLDYAVTHPEDSINNTRILTVLADNDVFPESARDDIYALIDSQIKTNPNQATYFKLIKITSATSYDDSETALGIFETLTYADILEMLQKNSNSENSNDKIEEASKKQWTNILILKSEIENKIGRSHDAIATLRRALTVDPDNAILLNNLGYIMAINGEDLHEALDIINRSLEIAPDAYNTIDSKAWIQYLLGKYDEALNTMDHFFSTINLPLDQLVPDNADAPTVTDATDNSNEAEPDFIDVDEEVHPIIKTLQRYNINIEAITPVLTHLMAIYDALGATDKATYIYDGIAELEPDDEVIVKFKNKHKK